MLLPTNQERIVRWRHKTLDAYGGKIPGSLDPASVIVPRALRDILSSPRFSARIPRARYRDLAAAQAQTRQSPKPAGPRSKLQPPRSARMNHPRLGATLP